MESLKKICARIGLQEEVTEKILELESKQDFFETEKEISELTEAENWQKAREKLKKFLGEDPDGIKMLFCMLKASVISWEKYQEQGIEALIFDETMKCFTRFVEEHKVSYGIYGFDRDFWTGRQLSLQLFRLGELEYEMVEEEKEGRYISIHIPSDAVLDPKKIKESLQEAKVFFEKYDSSWKEVPYKCCSWLLSPALKELLGEKSKILKFQEMFSIEEVYKDSDEFMEWVFKRKDIPLEKLPEETSLQRNMKAHLLSGGWVGEGMGCLKEETLM